MTSEEFIEDFRKNIKSFETFDDFTVELVKRIENNEPISENGMNDGFVIGLMMVKASIIYDILTGKLGEAPVSDNSVKIARIVLIWLLDNWGTLKELPWER